MPKRLKKKNPLTLAFFQNKDDANVQNDSAYLTFARHVLRSRYEASNQDNSSTVASLQEEVRSSTVSVQQSREQASKMKAKFDSIENGLQLELSAARGKIAKLESDLYDSDRTVVQIESENRTVTLQLQELARREKRQSASFRGVVSQRDVAGALGVAQSTLSRLFQIGMPMTSVAAAKAWHENHERSVEESYRHSTEKFKLSLGRGVLTPFQSKGTSKKALVNF
jgi:hypothetical protein